MRRYGLKEKQWEKIKDLLPGRKQSVGVTAQDNRLFVEAVLYRYRAGISWRDLPERFGDFRVIHTRHTRWSKTGIWEKIFIALSEDSDNEYVMIDSTIVRHQHSAGAKKKKGDEAIGRSSGGLSTKIHATCDALGNPTGFHLTGGQAHDLDGADVLLENMCADALLADKAYDAEDRVLKKLKGKACEAVIPPKSVRKIKRKYDKFLYYSRHLIENFFCKLKQFSAIATRYDKRANNFLGGIYLAATVILLN
nr:IS5 family transposase [Legionella septentrionalis]